MRKLLHAITVATVLGLTVESQGEPIAAHGRVTAGTVPAELAPEERAELLARRARVLAAGGNEVNAINRALAQDAIRRAIRVHDAWMTRRDAGTGLFPQSATNAEWNYRNTAADFFGFECAIAMDQLLPSVPLLRGTLAAERSRNPAGKAGGLCRCIDSVTGRDIRKSDRERLFSTCEYLKDGLVPLFERTGDPDVLARMQEIADAIVASCNVDSRFGKIPSRDSEINGDVLQAFGRLGFACGEDGRKYHDALGVLADAVIGQMLSNPQGPGAPVHFYDYPNDRFPSGAVRLRDHGNETAVGLAEAFATAVARRNEAAWGARAERWADPLARMFETLLSRGVNARGLLVTQLDGGGGRSESPPHELAITDAEPCDNWGYLLCGALLFVEAEQRRGGLAPARLNALLAKADAIAIAVTRTDNLKWEGDNPDGFADTIESAIQVAAHRAAVRQPLLEWADGQIVYLFKSQRPDGFCTGDYLDGNVIRTAMLYADARSGKPGPERWREVMKLPWDWPRVNAWPSWNEAAEVRH